METGMASQPAQLAVPAPALAAPAPVQAHMNQQAQQVHQFNIGTNATAGPSSAKEGPAANDPGTVKKKRPQSCDTCRQRKIKCVRLQVEGLEPGQDQRCVQCRAIDAKCTFDYIPKRPGPQSSFARTAKREQQAHAQAQARAQAQAQARAQATSYAPISQDQGQAQVPSSQGQAASTASTSQLPAPAFGLSAWPQEYSQHAVTQHNFPVQPPLQQQPYDHFASQIQTIGMMGTATPSQSEIPQYQLPQSFSYEQHPVAGLPTSYLQQHLKLESKFDGTDLPFGAAQMPRSTQGQHRSGAPSLVSPPIKPFGPIWSPDTSETGSPSNLHRPPHSQSQTDSLPKTKPPHLGKVFAGPVERPRSLDDIAPRQTFLSIIALYFQHLFALLPLVHRPTFSHDLISRRDERDEVFLAFVLSLTSYTIIQCPRSVIPAPWSFYRKLHQICHTTSRRLQPRRYDPAQLLHLCTLYCDHIYLGSTGQNNAANAVLGEAVRTAFTVGVHDERRFNQNSNQLPPPAGAPPPAPPPDAIERELRRRVYFLIYGSDKTIAVLQDEPISLRDDDTFGVDIPLTVDDDLLTAAGAFPQPVHERGPSILCGFATVSRLFRLLSELLETYRRDRRRPPMEYGQTRERLRYIRGLLQRVRQTLAEMPEQLKSPNFGPPQQGTQPGRSNSAHESGQPFQANLATLQAAAASQADAQGSPWPPGTFTAEGLPNPEIRSQPSSSTQPSPRAWSHAQLAMSSQSAPNVTPSQQQQQFEQNQQQQYGEQQFSANAPQGQHQNNQPPSATQLSAAMDQVAAFRPPPPQPQSPQPPILSPFATMRANILVTEALIRFVLVEYRELLEGLLANYQASNHSEHAESVNGEADDDWEAAAKDMLDVLQSMPMESLAANGQSLIAKVIFVVSSLLNRTATNTRGYAYLCDFLGMLSKLSHDRSAADAESDMSDEDRGDGNTVKREMAMAGGASQ